MKPLKIVEVRHIEGYTLAIKFDDGKESIVDFSEFLNSSRHRQIVKYKKIENFLAYTIINGDLVWNDYELCFPIYDLYMGEIVKTPKEQDLQRAS